MENKTSLVDRYLSELLNTGNFAGVEEILAPNFVFYGPSTRNGLDCDGFQRYIKETRAAFSNKQFTELDRIVDGDRVALRFRMTGTQDGIFHGIPPSGAAIDVEGCDVIYIGQDKITEIRAYFDLMPVIQNLLIPLPARIVGGLVGNLFSR